MRYYKRSRSDDKWLNGDLQRLFDLTNASVHVYEQTGTPVDPEEGDEWINGAVWKKYLNGAWKKNITYDSDLEDDDGDDDGGSIDIGSGTLTAAYLIATGENAPEWPGASSDKIAIKGGFRVDTTPTSLN